MDPKETPGVGRNMNGTGCAPEFEVVSPAPVQVMHRPNGIVLNRDHVVGAIVGAGLFALAFYIFRKCDK